MDGKQALDFGASSDFPSLLRLQGLLAPAAQIGPMNARGEIVPTESTTILAFKFSDGVLVAGDRRATSGNTVVYDRADKVLEIDRRSIMASHDHADIKTNHFCFVSGVVFLLDVYSQKVVTNFNVLMHGRLLAHRGISL